MFCSRCGSPNEDGPEVAFCRRCGARLLSADQGALSDVQGGGAAAMALRLRRPIEEHSRAQPIWLFVLLMLATYNLYLYYWIYRNWRHIRDYGDQGIRPFWRTVGSAVPVLNLFFLYSQFSHVEAMAERAGREARLSPGFALLGIIVANALGYLPWPYSLLSLLLVVPTAFVQAASNRFWEDVYPDLRTPTQPSAGQVALIVIGALIWLLVIAAILVPREPEGLMLL